MMFPRSLLLLLSGNELAFYLLEDRQKYYSADRQTIFVVRWHASYNFNDFLFLTSFHA